MIFKPRTTATGIKGSKYWYSNTNPFYASGYGMPNCTCYSWGRFWEETPNYIPRKLPTGDGGQWWGMANASGYYKTGQTPALGAVICFDNPGKSGHVAIVEEILKNGDIVTSNSAWRGTFFYMQTLKKSNNYSWSTYRCQGFIYNPHIDKPIPPEPGKTGKRTQFKWVLYARRLRRKRIC